MKKVILTAVLISAFFALNAKEVTGKVLDGYYAPDSRKIHLVALDLNDDGKFSCIDDILIIADHNSPVYTGFSYDVRYPKNSLLTFDDSNARLVTRINGKGFAETNREVSAQDVIAINRQSVLEGEKVSRYTYEQQKLAFPLAHARREQARRIKANN